jgi:hypothetical protein
MRGSIGIEVAIRETDLEDKCRMELAGFGPVATGTSGSVTAVLLLSLRHITFMSTHKSTQVETYSKFPQRSYASIYFHSCSLAEQICSQATSTAVHKLST